MLLCTHTHGSALGGPPHTNQWKIKLVPVRWLSVASAGPLNDPFLGIVTSWRWLGEGVSTKPPNLKGRGRGGSLEAVLLGRGEGPYLGKMALVARYGPTWAALPGGSSLGASALQGLLQRCLVVSAHLLSLGSTTSRQSSQTRSTTPVIHAQKHLPCPPVCIILAPWCHARELRARTSLCHSPAVCP